MLMHSELALLELTLMQILFNANVINSELIRNFIPINFNNF